VAARMKIGAAGTTAAHRMWKLALERGRFSPTGIRWFLCALGRGKTSFLAEETISSISILFPH
jgi:hypothetical protein